MVMCEKAHYRTEIIDLFEQDANLDPADIARFYSNRIASDAVLKLWDFAFNPDPPGRAPGWGASAEATPANTGAQTLTRDRFVKTRVP